MFFCVDCSRRGRCQLETLEAMLAAGPIGCLGVAGQYAMDLGRSFLTAADVRPGNVVRKPLSMAAHRVQVVG